MVDESLSHLGTFLKMNNSLYFKNYIQLNIAEAKVITMGKCSISRNMTPSKFLGFFPPRKRGMATST